MMQKHTNYFHTLFHINTHISSNDIDSSNNVNRPTKNTTIFSYMKRKTKEDLLEETEKWKQKMKNVEYDHLVQLYKGSAFISSSHKYNSKTNLFYDSSKNKISKKVIALDLDETIGCFTDLYTIWNILKIQYPNLDQRRVESAHQCGENIDKLWKTKQILFNKLLSLYPEFLRYGILSILEYLHHKILSFECNKIYIYTNNQCIFPEWISLIISYLNKQVGAISYSIFETPICAFKINNQIVEKSRTTNEKTHADFIHCTMLPETTEICFMDDKEHVRMKHERIYYIQPPPYYHSLNKETIISRFFNSKLYELCFKKSDMNAIVNSNMTTKTPLMQKMEKYLNVYGHYSNKQDVFENMDDEKIVAFNSDVHKRVFYLIKEFFLLSTKKQKTEKHRIVQGKYSRKIKI